ncbi:unnamed protein product [Angiostrongylus costaricensis]|uniref:PRELI/MSF1 domain-containing protein n=1 Tax=Angiostrongylus costaricensis TaxID=334426 RepID=A0A0R3PKZ8_ANGCS|nr:unnamed protein product [Angiostrongylus costaricensis]
MKIWNSKHVFDHNLETVFTAAWREYPNSMNQGVTGIDVLRQTLYAGKIMSERFIQSYFHIPSWVTKLTGFSVTQYSRKYTVIDPSRTTSLTTNCLQLRIGVAEQARNTFVHSVDGCRRVRSYHLLINFTVLFVYLWSALFLT